MRDRGIVRDGVGWTTNLGFSGTSRTHTRMFPNKLYSPLEHVSLRQTSFLCFSHVGMTFTFKIRPSSRARGKSSTFSGISSYSSRFRHGCAELSIQSIHILKTLAV